MRGISGRRGREYVFEIALVYLHGDERVVTVPLEVSSIVSWFMTEVQERAWQPQHEPDTSSWSLILSALSLTYVDTVLVFTEAPVPGVYVCWIAL